jgi:hypothetical protein
MVQSRAETFWVKQKHNCADCILLGKSLAVVRINAANFGLPP